MDQWNVQQRAFAIKMFYKNNDNLEGFSKVPVFLCHPVIAAAAGVGFNSLIFSNSPSVIIKVVIAQ